jgi:nucleoside-diphosphate kinase
MPPLRKREWQAFCYESFSFFHFFILSFCFSLFHFFVTLTFPSVDKNQTPIHSGSTFMSNLHPVIKGIKKQRTFCMIKPDGVARGLIGEIVLRLEKAGLKVVSMEMRQATEAQVRAHYPMSDQAWVDRLGDKGLSTFEGLQLDAKEFLGTNDRSEIGHNVAESLVAYMTSGPVVVMIVEGIQAVDMVRKLAGHTLPFKADMGTIRGDFSVDSPAIANVEGRAIHNLFHASETQEEAANEMKLWFGEEVAMDYIRTGEDVMYSKTY